MTRPVILVVLDGLNHAVGHHAMGHLSALVEAGRGYTTHLDCELGEYCDQTTGNCYPSNEGHCESCDIWDTNSCGPGGTCVGEAALVPWYASLCSGSPSSCG